MNHCAEKLKTNQDQSWNAMYEVAKEYYFTHGDLAVPSNYVTPEGKRLGAWLAYQRKKCAEGELSEERISMLDAIGMIW